MKFGLTLLGCIVLACIILGLGKLFDVLFTVVLVYLVIAELLWTINMLTSDFISLGGYIFSLVATVFYPLSMSYSLFFRLTQELDTIILYDKRR